MAQEHLPLSRFSQSILDHEKERLQLAEDLWGRAAEIFKRPSLEVADHEIRGLLIFSKSVLGAGCLRELIHFFQEELPFPDNSTSLLQRSFEDQINSRKGAQIQKVQQIIDRYSWATTLEDQGTVMPTDEETRHRVAGDCAFLGALWESSDPQKARLYYERAHSLSPGREDYQTSFNRVVVACEVASRQESGVNAKISAGLAAMVQLDYERAVETFREALALSPGCVEAQTELLKASVLMKGQAVEAVL